VGFSPCGVFLNLEEKRQRVTGWQRMKRMPADAGTRLADAPY